MQIAVIGGGAAGLLAGIAAAEAGAQVTLLERNNKPLKKLGVTGNGRGNLMNAGEPVYYGDSAFAISVLARCGYPALKAFFAALGVPLREEGEGRVYPASLQASVVQDALLLRAKQLAIDIRCRARVKNIARERDGYLLSGELRLGDDPKNPAFEPFTLHADKVIVACGGAAYPVHGTDGTGYDLLTSFGHRCTPLTPALCALSVKKKQIQGLKGQRVRAKLTLTDAQEKPVHQARGEALFADDAVSGIAAMQLARFAKPGMRLCLDLRDELNMDAPVLSLVQSLAAARADQAVAELLTGAFTRPVSRWILREAGVKDIAAPVASLSPNTLGAIARTIEGIRVSVLGTRGFESAQVTAGGLKTEDFDPETMESRLSPGLYAAGEVLNVDGDCGGFNLMFAFASGLLAGSAAGGTLTCF